MRMDNLTLSIVLVVAILSVAAVGLWLGDKELTVLTDDEIVYFLAGFAAGIAAFIIAHAIAARRGAG